MVRVDLWNFSSSVQLDSSQVSAANEWDVELNTISEIPYLEANMYYFVYHINTIAPNWREKSTLSTNENKRIDNSRTKLIKCVGDKAQYEKKSAEPPQNNSGRNFQYSKLSVINFFVAYRKSAHGKSSICRFSFSAARNVITKATEYVTFSLFWFSFPSREVWMSLSVS